MSEGKREAEWDELSHLLAVIANCHRGRNTSVIRPERFNPYAKVKEVSRAEFLTMFKQMMVPENLKVSEE